MFMETPWWYWPAWPAYFSGSGSATNQMAAILKQTIPPQPVNIRLKKHPSNITHTHIEIIERIHTYTFMHPIQSGLGPTLWKPGQNKSNPMQPTPNHKLIVYIYISYMYDVITYVCIYIYIYYFPTHTYIYIYTHIYIYTFGHTYIK